MNDAIQSLQMAIEELKKDNVQRDAIIQKLMARLVTLKVGAINY